MNFCLGRRSDGQFVLPTTFFSHGRANLSPPRKRSGKAKPDKKKDADEAAKVRILE